MSIVEDAFGNEFLNSILGWVGDYCSPEDVFSQGDLEEWARDNGFVLYENDMDI